MKEVILRKGNCVLINDHAAQQYIVGVDYDPDAPKGQQWGYGLYFPYWMNAEKEVDALLAATEILLIKTDENYVSKARLEQIATAALHELKEIDEDSFIDFCEGDLDLTDEEKEWFGLNEEEENDRDS